MRELHEIARAKRRVEAGDSSFIDIGDKDSVAY